MNKEYSKNVRLASIFFTSVVILFVFLALIPKPLKEDEVQKYEALANQIATAGLYPKDNIEETNYLSDIVRNLSSVTIKQHEYNSYLISFDLASTDSNGVLNFRVDENGVRGPIWDCSLMLLISFVVSVVLWITLYYYMKSWIDKATKTGFLSKIPEEPDKVDLSNEIEDAFKSAEEHEDETDSFNLFDKEEKEFKIHSRYVKYKPHVFRKKNNRKNRLGKKREKEAIRELYSRIKLRNQFKY